MEIDLRSATYDEFVRAIFDHPVEAGGDADNAWYWSSHARFLVDPSRQVRHLTRLFENAGQLRTEFSVPQIEQGLWLVAAAASERFIQYLWSADVPWSERERCIAAMATLYSECLSVETFETIDYMWPDLLADTYSYDFRAPSTDIEDRRVQDALLVLFTKLLGFPDYATQYAGLHGLGHLAHPEGPRVINEYIAAHPNLEEEQRQYAEQAAAGDVL
jgi:hypothetical protein